MLLHQRRPNHHARPGQDATRHSTRGLSRALLAGVLALAPALACSQSLPDSPGALLFADAQQAAGSNSTPTQATEQTPAERAQAASDQAQSALPKLPPCSKLYWGWRLHPGIKGPAPCEEDPLQLIVNPGNVKPLTPTDKLILAGRATVDPFNLVTIFGYSGVYVAANSHSAYGPGIKGFGRLAGYSLLGDAQGNFFGIYAIPVLAHEDPRYHRMPGSPIRRRILHALVHTVVSQHDDGTLMPNYATLLTYPIGAELSNLYVPGIGSNAPSTTKRILLGYATDPSGALIAEFLPDVAKRIHIHVVFVQQILLQVENNGAKTQ